MLFKLIYFFKIIDQLFKFGKANILSNKKPSGVLGHIKEFIFTNWYIIEYMVIMVKHFVMLYSQNIALILWLFIL